jgi:hypothetical protein
MSRPEVDRHLTDNRNSGELLDGSIAEAPPSDDDETYH